MSEITILDNLNKEIDESDSLWPSDDGNTGLGVQFRLFTAAVVSRIKVRLGREGWNGYNGPTGHIVARLYGSHTGTFRDANDYAEGLISESNNSLDCEDISSNWEGSVCEFEFSNVSLPAGVYFLCLWSNDMIIEDHGTSEQMGVIRWLATESAVSTVGPWTFWYPNAEGGARWGSAMED